MITNTQQPHRARVKVGRIRTDRGAYHEDDTGYNTLAAAIVLQAVHDYKAARRCLLKKDRDNVVCLEGSGQRSAAHVIEDVTIFLKSPWFGTLCDIDPRVIMRELERR